MTESLTLEVDVVGLRRLYEAFEAARPFNFNVDVSQKRWPGVWQLDITPVFYEDYRVWHIEYNIYWSNTNGEYYPDGTGHSEYDIWCGSQPDTSSLTLEQTVEFFLKRRMQFYPP